MTSPKPTKWDRVGCRLGAVAAAAALAALPAPPPVAALQAGGYDYPSGSTPPEVAEAMLELAGVSASDTVYDLGSGEGAIVIRAVREHGAAAVGIEIDSGLVAASRRRAREAGVERKVRFVHGDFFEVALRPATVVTTYLLPGTMRRLERHLLRELRAGTRIVSHDFDMESWPADSVTGWWGGVGGRTTLFLWIVPARLGGTWVLHTPEGDSVRVRLDQNYQRLRARTVGSSVIEVREARVAGDSVRFRLTDPGGRTSVLRGTATPVGMSGRTERGEPWRARRLDYGDSSLVDWAGN